MILYMLKSSSSITFNWFKIRVFFFDLSIIPSTAVSILFNPNPHFSRKGNSFFFILDFLDQSQKYSYNLEFPLFHGIASLFYFFLPQDKKTAELHIYFHIFYLILQKKSARIIFLPI
jgi:hypothetical protein